MRKLLRLGILVFSVLFLSMPTAAEAELKENVESFIPAEYQQYCMEIGDRYQVCPELLIAMIEQESAGKPYVSNGACLGLMQVNEYYHADRMARLGVSSLYDPYGNILVGADYLHELFLEYKDTGTVLMVYNGKRNAVSLGAAGDYTDYATIIMKRAAAMEALHR